MKYIFITFSIFYTISAYAQIKNDGSFVDNRDGKSYTFTEYNNLLWMNQNLSYKTSASFWVSPVDQTYLYTYETAKNLCPKGWRLPTQEEYKAIMYENDVLKSIGFIGAFSNDQPGFVEDGEFSKGIGGESWGYYWTSSKNISNGKIWMFWIASGRSMNTYLVNWGSESDLKQGRSVRCVYDK